VRRSGERPEKFYFSKTGICMNRLCHLHFQILSNSQAIKALAVRCCQNQNRFSLA
jgi:hypothetical protein